MKKKYISLMAIMALMFAPVSMPKTNAQIFILEEEDEEEEDEEKERLDVDDQGLELPVKPQLGITIDALAPLGGEILLLGCLGGAYLVGKRKGEHSKTVK